MEGFVINSKAFISDEGKYLSIKLSYEGILLKFRKKSIIAELILWMLDHESVDYPENITIRELRELISLRLIIPNRFSLCVEQGVTSEARSYSDFNITNFESISLGMVIIGSAVDYAQVGDRTSFVGPKEIRRYLRNSIQDAGNVAWFTSDSLVTYGLRVAYCMYLCHLKNSFPIVLGGDHSITKFCFQEVVNNCNSSIGLIHFDAHNDFGDTESESNLDNLMHSNVIAHISQMDCEFIAQIGLRKNQIISVNKPSSCPVYQLQDSESSRFSKYVGNIIQKHPKVPVYLSVDIDCLDPEIADEVAAPLKGGINGEQLVDMVRNIFERFNVVGMDIVEVCNSNSGVNNAAKIAARIIEAIDERFH